MFVFFVIAVAAAEVAVGLALIVDHLQAKHSIDVDQVSSLKGYGMECSRWMQGE